MSNSKLLIENDLEENSTDAKAKELFLQQIENWSLARQNYSDLKSVKNKVFKFDGFQITIQFNSGRIISSSAKVDFKSIKERPCFLCTDNLPIEQKGIICNDDYILLVNPFPIFPEHFTIPQLQHNPQQIYSNIKPMLQIVKKLGGKYSLFYNGPKCGASAPDHMHFQASTKNRMPIETEIDYLYNNSKELKVNSSTRVLAVTNYLRNLFLIETDDINSGMTEFQKLYKTINGVILSDDEPLLNVIATYSDKWRIYIFPRKAHRPAQYFFEGDKQIVISPASVDFGGLMIAPKEEDFNKLTKENIVNIFKQTTIDENLFSEISLKYSC